MSRLSSRAGIVTIALLSVLTASLAVVVAVDSGGGPVRAAGSATNKTLTVSGDGTGQGLPDTLVVTFSVHSHDSSVQAVLSDIDADGHKLLSTLKSQGVPGKDLQTTDLSLNPSYDNHGNITGYDASESVSARIHPLKSAGNILATAATSAGNSVNIDGISLDISDKSGPLNQARANAFAQALAAAQKDAALAHETLGGVLSIKETQQSSVPPQPYNGYATAAAGLDAAKSIAVAPGRQDVTVTLDVVWALD